MNSAQKPQKTAENSLKKNLSAKEHLFVSAVISGKNQTESARFAGYKETACMSMGVQLMARPHVRAAVVAGLEEVRKKGLYGYELAMKEAERAYNVAEETENANAMVKAAELRSKLTGLLVEKQHLTIETVDIRGALSEALNRARTVEEIEGKSTPLLKAVGDRAYALLDRTNETSVELQPIGSDKKDKPAE